MSEGQWTMDEIQREIKDIRGELLYLKADDTSWRRERIADQLEELAEELRRGA